MPIFSTSLSNTDGTGSPPAFVRAGWRISSNAHSSNAHSSKAHLNTLTPSDVLEDRVSKHGVFLTTCVCASTADARGEHTSVDSAYSICGSSTATKDGARQVRLPLLAALRGFHEGMTRASTRTFEALEAWSWGDTAVQSRSEHLPGGSEALSDAPCQAQRRASASCCGEIGCEGAEMGSTWLCRNYGGLRLSQANM